MPRNFLAILTAITLAACGGGADSASESVSYDGETLIVRSVRYDRIPANTIQAKTVCEAASGCYVGGEILIKVRDTDAFIKISTELDIRLSSGGPQGLTVPVPMQFERQWVRALLNEPSIATAAIQPL